LWVRPEAYQEWRLLALPQNIIPSWKNLLGINTLAYYEHSQITDVKSLKTLATELTDENMGIEIIKPGKKTIFHCNQGKAYSQFAQ
jgi:hypothetical protein